jgi:hypothetical protein
MTARRKAGTPTSMIARVALVLDAVERHSPTAVSEVARDTGLPKPPSLGSSSNSSRTISWLARNTSSAAADE